MAFDHISWKTVWTITKFRDPENRISRLLKAGLSILDAIRMFPGSFIGVVSWDGNCALNEGLGELIDIICGLGAPALYDHATAYLGVGNSDTVALATQTGLQGASKAFAAIDATYPVRVDQTVEWRATFAAGVGSFNWLEQTVVNGDDDAHKNLNRCVSDKGTKTAAEAWVLSLKITFS